MAQNVIFTEKFFNTQPHTEPSFIIFYNAQILLKLILDQILRSQIFSKISNKINLKVIRRLQVTPEIHLISRIYRQVVLCKHYCI